MRRLLLVLLFCAPLWAQTQSPIVQTAAASTFGTTCTFQKDVTSGNVLLVSEYWFNSTGAITPSDTRSSSWTQLKLDNTGGSGRPGGVIYGTIVGSSGSEAITISVASSGGFEGIVCAEVRGSLYGITVDVSDNAGFSNSQSSTPNTLTSGSYSTTVNGDFIYTTVGGNRGATVQNADTSNAMIDLGHSHHGDTATQMYKIAGVAGSYTSSAINTNNDLSTMLTVALKPVAGNNPAIITSATLPDGALSQPYSFCPKAIGGTAALTWSITSGSLQPGFNSIDSSTGCITGTPVAGPQNTFTLSVTDGTHTPGTQSATLKVGSSLNTIAHVQDATCCNSTSQSFGSNVTSGNLVFVGTYTQAGETPKCTDTLGTDFQPLTSAVTRTANSGVSSGQILVGLAPSTGADTVACASGTLLTATEFSNVYVAMDNIDITNGSSASPITSNNLTTLVPNELLAALAIGWTGSTSWTATSPFTGIGATSGGKISYNSSTSVTTYSVGYSYTGLNTGCTCWALSLAALRPTAGAAAPAPGSTQVGGFLVQ